MEVDDFEILSIDVTFYLERVQKLVFNGPIKMKKRIYFGPAFKGLNDEQSLMFHISTQDKYTHLQRRLQYFSI